MNLISTIIEFIFGGKAFAENDIAEQLNRIEGGSVNVPDESVPSGVTPNTDINPQEAADTVDNTVSGFDFGGFLSSVNDTIHQVLSPVMEFLNNLTGGNVLLSKIILVSILTLVSIIVIIIMLVIINKFFRHSNQRKINTDDDEDEVYDDDYDEIDNIGENFDEDSDGSSFNEVDNIEDIENLKNVEDFEDEYSDDVSQNQEDDFSQENIAAEDAKIYFKEEFYPKPQDINSALEIFYKVTK